jgi:hypothetical protein
VKRLACWLFHPASAWGEPELEAEHKTITRGDREVLRTLLSVIEVQERRCPKCGRVERRRVEL